MELHTQTAVVAPVRASQKLATGRTIIKTTCCACGWFGAAEDISDLIELFEDHRREHLEDEAYKHRLISTKQAISPMHPFIVKLKLEDAETFKRFQAKWNDQVQRLNQGVVPHRRKSQKWWAIGIGLLLGLLFSTLALRCQTPLTEKPDLSLNVPALSVDDALEITATALSDACKTAHAAKGDISMVIQMYQKKGHSAWYLAVCHDTGKMEPLKQIENPTEERKRRKI